MDTKKITFSVTITVDENTETAVALNMLTKALREQLTGKPGMRSVAASVEGVEYPARTT